MDVVRNVLHLMSIMDDYKISYVVGGGNRVVNWLVTL